MRKEVTGLLAAMAAGVFVVAASYGLCALLAPRAAGHAMKIMPMKDMPMQAMGMKGVDRPVRDDHAQAALAATGRTLFISACSSCHGANARGDFGPSLYDLNLSEMRIAAIIKNGIKPRMPGFGGKYSQTQRQALVAYVRSLKK